MSKVSLILEGGGMRGCYTAGVLDYFLDKGLMFKDIIGVSAGACNSVSYISKQKGRNLKINAGYCTDKRYVSMSGIFTRGSIFGMEFLFDKIPNELVPLDYDSFYNSDCRLIAVTTDCETGKGHYTRIDDLRTQTNYIRASSSIPMLAPIVEIEGKKLLDGGTADSIPVHYSVENGFDKHVLVLTRHNGYIKKPNKLYSLSGIAYRQYPKLVESIKKRHIHYNESVRYAEKLEKENKAIIIRPKSPLDISRFEKDPEKLRKLYELGYQDAQEAYENIITFCNNCGNVKLGAF